MITEKELNPDGIRLTNEQRQNFLYHYYAMNEFRARYGKPMIVRSSIRTVADHQLIYMRINARRANAGLSPIPCPKGSAHLLAAATDFDDKDHEIYLFCENNTELLYDFGIYVEQREWTPTWCHLQTIPPASGRRFFVPYKL